MRIRVAACLGLLLFTFTASAAANPFEAVSRAAPAELERGFAVPPASARPWVFWFWINGNISKAGITADLEALHSAGVGGVLWMEVSGPWWAPEGKVRALSPEWHEAFQWAIKECDRLGMEFDISVDFGYGSGGPHITPELSMQKLFWSETEVEGDQKVGIVLPRPEVPKNIAAWLRPGAEIGSKVREQIETIDSYRDVAVVAIPAPTSPEARAFRIPELNLKDGTDWRLPRSTNAPAIPGGAVSPKEAVVDLTDHMNPDGRLTWQVPPGKWLVFRYGHATNLKMTRPCPAAAVGLECDRLAPVGIETHYAAFLKKIFEDAGSSAGKALTHVHVDSWEAGGQNWTSILPGEFRRRRGYDLRPWLPVLTGRVVGSLELSERFLWDMRATVSEMIRDNYAGRLRDLARQHGIKLSIEAYGHLCIDNLAYGGVSDLPISEFWARGDGLFPGNTGRDHAYEFSTKALASVAHTGGKPVIGAEAFTSDRGWRDHPFLLKAMGDKKYCEGLNRMIFHLSAHQAYDDMVPGLTHRKWGEHFQRHNTWWNFSRPWNDYLARCQYLLQAGRFVADICYWVGEGAPLQVDLMRLAVPPGYDYDVCSAGTVLQMSVRDGLITLPSGMSYRYLVLPPSDRMTLPLARKVRELVAGGARIIGQQRITGAHGLTGYPHSDTEVANIAAALWDNKRIITGMTIAEVLEQDTLEPDFEGQGLLYIHRRAGPADIYFISHQENRRLDATCSFRVRGTRPELWDPETGEIRTLPGYCEKDGRTSVPLRFEPMQSWFVVFREPAAAPAAALEENFPRPSQMASVAGPWQVSFDPKWGGPEQVVNWATLTDWSKHSDPRIRYYSGTASYRAQFEVPHSRMTTGRVLVNLGAVEVMARVRLNGHDCGIVWKPPYMADITRALRAGDNHLEVEVVNLWVNRLIGDERLPLDGDWKDFETLLQWPDWFGSGKPRLSGRYTFTSARHYRADSPLLPSGLLGPVTIQSEPRIGLKEKH